MSDEWFPCSLMEYPADLQEMGLPRYGVLFDAFGTTQTALENRGFMGGGYTWHGIVESMIRTEHPELAASIEYAPESSQFVARSSELDSLRAVTRSIKEALEDGEVLQQAIDGADPAIIE